MLFYKEYTFITPYTKEEIRSRVKELKRDSNKRSWIFEGNVGTDEFTFVARFYPNDYRGYMPEVHGCMMEGNKILLKQRLPVSLKILFYIGIPFNMFIWFYALFNGGHKEFLIGLPICAIIGVSMLLVEFHQRGNRMVQILMTKLKLQKI